MYPAADLRYLSWAQQWKHGWMFYCVFVCMMVTRFKCLCEYCTVCIIFYASRCGTLISCFHIMASKWHCSRCIINAFTNIKCTPFIYEVSFLPVSVFSAVFWKDADLIWMFNSTSCNFYRRRLVFWLTLVGCYRQHSFYNNSTKIRSCSYSANVSINKTVFVSLSC